MILLLILGRSIAIRKDHEQDQDHEQEFLGIAPPTVMRRALRFWAMRRGIPANFYIWLWQWMGMSVTIELSRQTENERKKHEADCLFLFWRKDENLASCRLWGVAVLLHSDRRLTCSDRYFRRIFSS